MSILDRNQMGFRVFILTSVLWGERCTTSCESKKWSAIASYGAPEVGYLDFDDAECMATLIGQHTAITAAHCVNFISGNSSAGTGRTIRFFAQSDGTMIVQARVVATRSFGTSTGSRDVALLRLDRDPPSSLRRREIAASADFDRLPAYGFGRVACGNITGDVRRIYITCFNSLFTSAPVCVGDSGAPLILGQTGPIFAITSGTRPADECSQGRYANAAELAEEIRTAAAMWGDFVAINAPIPPEVLAAGRPPAGSSELGVCDSANIQIGTWAGPGP